MTLHRGDVHAVVQQISAPVVHVTEHQAVDLRLRLSERDRDSTLVEPSVAGLVAQNTRLTATAVSIAAARAPQLWHTSMTPKLALTCGNAESAPRVSRRPPENELLMQQIKARGGPGVQPSAPVLSNPSDGGNER